MGNTYADRNAIIRSMGFESYKEGYLKSEHWARIRTRAFAYHGNKCRLCKNRANIIHHISYGLAVLQGLDLKQLAPMCNVCHEKIEKKPSGTKRSLAEVHTEYLRLLRQSSPLVVETTNGNWKGGSHCKTCNSKLRKGLDKTNKPFPCKVCQRNDSPQDEIRMNAIPIPVKVSNIVLPEGVDQVKRGKIKQRYHPSLLGPNESIQDLCMRCNTALRDNWFCPGCRKPSRPRMTMEQLKSMIGHCPGCGHRVKSNGKPCKNCKRTGGIL